MLVADDKAGQLTESRGANKRTITKHAPYRSEARRPVADLAPDWGGCTDVLVVARRTADMSEPWSAGGWR